jgi:hypothetical protein
MKQNIRTLFLGRLVVFAACIFGLFSCREPFEPEPTQVPTSVLVVEGYLDTEGLESELKLSRTVPVNSEESLIQESGALVRVLASNGTAYPLQEEEPGVYIFNYDLPEEGEYRLEIVLRGGDRYESSLMQPIITPEILDAGFVRDEDGVEIFVSTQGNESADDFLWTFEETWIYRPRIRTGYIYDATIKDVRFRTDEEQIALCFKTESSPDILLETSSRFQEQVVFRKTISEIPIGDERIQERYSILISQKAIDPSAVKFWETLKRNTEDIGSIFSPLPSQITGNIKSLDDESTPVVGQVSMGVTKQRRVYVNLQDVAPWGYIDPEFNDCVISEAPVMINDYESIFSSGFVLPARELMVGTSIVGYFTTPKKCADCTLYASPIVPDFWEDD